MSSAVTDAPASRMTPYRADDPAFGRLVRLVQAWHVALAVGAIWVLVNVSAGIWELTSVPRTAYGVLGSLLLALNVLAIFLLARRSRSGRTLSFLVSALVALGCVVLLFRSLELAEGLDVFAGAFERAFPPLMLVSVGVIWWVIARRVRTRLLPPGALITDFNVNAGAVRAANALMYAGLAIVAVGGAWWLWELRLQNALSFFWDAISADPWGILAAAGILALATWALRTIISPRSAQYFGVESAQAEALTGWLYLSPNLLGFLAFFAGPLVFSLIISFYDWDGLSQAVFIGLENYTKTLGLSVAGSVDALPAGYSELVGLPLTDSVLGASDPLFWKSIRNIFVFLVIAVPLAVGSALFLAIMIQVGYRGTKAYRTIFFIPSVAGVIGVTLIWKQMLNSTVGFVNWAIGEFNQFVNLLVPGNPLPDRVEFGWLSDPTFALFAVIIVFAWSQFGFNTVLFTAGLQGISRELYEAAELDGANAWQAFRNVTLPQLKATTFFVTATTVILALQLFDIVYALNQPNPVGSPDNATLTPVVYLYQLGFQQSAFGQASAVAWVLFIIIFFFTLAQFRRQRADAEGS